VFFYELHEGDDDAYSDVILAREEAMEPEDFFEVVQGIRRRILLTYEADTLIEAIAAELERDHGFVFVSDDRIAAAVNVSSEEDENFLIAADDELDANGLASADYRAVFVEYQDEDGGSRPN
jgi:hypothetical protein